MSDQNRQMTAKEALDEIHGILNGVEWDAVTPAWIAEVLESYGYIVRDLEDPSDEDGEAIPSGAAFASQEGRDE